MEDESTESMDDVAKLKLDAVLAQADATIARRELAEVRKERDAADVDRLILCGLVMLMALFAVTGWTR